MKLGIIITQTDPETVFNALRLAQYALKEGDKVRIFLSGRGVEMDQIEDAKFDVKQIAQEVLNAGAQFLACGTCLKLRQSCLFGLGLGGFDHGGVIGRVGIGSV